MGSLASFASAMPGGDGDGLRLYSDVLIPAGEYVFDEARDAALRGRAPGPPRPPVRTQQHPQGVFSPGVLAASELLGVVSSVQAASGQVPMPPELQAPSPSVAAARRTGQWKGPGGWNEALEDLNERVFNEFRSTKVVPVRRRCELIAQHCSSKAHTLRLVVSFKEKRSVDGAVTRKKARITAGDLISNGKIPDTFSANLAGDK